MRVALVCDDSYVLHESGDRLREWGAVAYPRASLSHAAEVAELCTVVLVFADGPTLMVVSDRTPPVWKPTLERHRPALVVERSEWTTRLLSLAAAPTG